MSNKMLHTPGPWTVYEEHNVAVGDGEGEGDEHSVVRLIHSHHPLVKATEESRANARLIAASPELLEFGKHILEILRHESLALMLHEDEKLSVAKFEDAVVKASYPCRGKN